MTFPVGVLRAPILCLGLALAGVAESGSQTHVYDADGRLIGVDYNTGERIDYPVDDIGNRTALQKQAAPATGMLAFSSASATVSEGAGNVALVVTRTGGSSGTASVTCSTTAGTATAGTDYAATSVVLNWAAGDSAPKSCTVPIIDDTSVESSETFTAALSNANGATLTSPSSTTVTVTDNDSPLQFTSATASVAEGAGSVTLSVTRTGSTDGAASVTCSSSNGTATAGSDYTATTTTLTWAAGTGGARNCTVPIADDALVESDETFTASLSNPSGATLGSPSAATVTITDNDSSLSFSSSTYSVAEGVGSVALTVTRTGSAAGPASVTCSTSPGTAAAGSDYTHTSTALSWTTGDLSSKTCSVSITDDSTVESGESFTALLSSPSGASLGSPSSATVTITDNDSTLQFSSVTASVSEVSGSVALTVTRTGSAAAAASVTCSTSSGTATAGSDYTHTSTSLTWAAGDGTSKTCTVPITDDSMVESSETFTASLSNPSGASLGSPSSATVTINDNDAQSVFTFSPSSYLKAENTGGTAVTITVLRGSGSSGAVSVQYATAHGTATAADYGAASGTLTWSDGDTSSKSFIVNVTNDSTPESDEYFTIALSNPTGNAVLGSPSTATVEIPCNDGYSCDGPEGE